MAKSLALTALLLTFSLTQVLGDINEIREAAIKKVNGRVHDVENFLNNTLRGLPGLEKNLIVITKHEREFGEGIMQNVHFQIMKIGVSAYSLANLKGISNQVFECIRVREREGHEENENYFTEKFMQPGTEYETRAIEIQKEYLRAWEKDYPLYMEQYGDLFEKTVRAIYASYYEEDILDIVNEFEKYTLDMGRVIDSINYNLKRVQMQILEGLEHLVLGVRSYSRSRVDLTNDLIWKCFPRAGFHYHKLFFSA